MQTANQLGIKSSQHGESTVVIGYENDVQINSEDENGPCADSGGKKGNQLEEAKELVLQLPSPERTKKRFSNLQQMKRKCTGMVRWEVGFAQLVPVAEREDPNFVIEKMEKPIITQEDISIMKVESPTKKMLKEYQRQQKEKAARERQRLAESFPNRVDKGILWPIWCDDEKLFAKYSRDKY